MKARKRILLYGNSVILGSIGTTLRRCPQFEVMELLPPLQEIKAFDSSKPNILFFDLETTDIEAVFSLLKTNTDISLIGISPGINLVEVWSGRQFRELSMKDLLELVAMMDGNREAQTASLKEREVKRKDDDAHNEGAFSQRINKANFGHSD